MTYPTIYRTLAYRDTPGADGPGRHTRRWGYQMKYTDTFAVKIEETDIQVEATADIEPYVPARGASYASGGEPDSGGYATIYRIEVVCPGPARGGRPAPVENYDASWLIKILGRGVIEHWEETIYSNAIESDNSYSEHRAGRRADLRRETDVLIERFSMLTSTIDP